MRRYFKLLYAWMLYPKPYRMLLIVMVKGFIVAMLCMIYTIYESSATHKSKSHLQQALYMVGAKMQLCPFSS